MAEENLIEISSSSEEDYISQEIITSSPSEDEEDDDDSGWSQPDDECSSDVGVDVDELDDDDEETMYTRVLRCLQEKSDLVDLSLKECKAYLRKNGLRLSGTKLECIRRIKEHWRCFADLVTLHKYSCVISGSSTSLINKSYFHHRVKDGNGEALYPRSSFTKDCTGDVCKGDIVLFTQKVYKNFDLVTRRGNILGKRTIAGRIVKESYGAAKQQHTFTVEVLWSKGMKKLPPLFPLLVKGRNLYRLRTFRQLWKNEKARREVLAEKHKRGAAARSVRAMRKVEIANKINAKASRKKGSTKFQKHPHQQRQHQKTEYGKENCTRASAGKRASAYYQEKPHPSRHLDSKWTREPRFSTSHRHQMQTHPNNSRESSFRSYPYPSPNFYHTPSGFYPHRAPNRSPPILDSERFNSYPEPSRFPVEHQEFSHVRYQHRHHSHFTHGAQSRNFVHFPDRWEGGC